jgi:hypothetical protein
VARAAKPNIIFKSDVQNDRSAKTCGLSRNGSAPPPLGRIACLRTFRCRALAHLPITPIPAGGDTSAVGFVDTPGILPWGLLAEERTVYAFRNTSSHDGNGSTRCLIRQASTSRSSAASTGWRRYYLCFNAGQVKRRAHKKYSFFRKLTCI